MKFIKEIEPRLNKNGHSKKWAIFKCPECLQEVERRLENGLRQKSCGCDKNIRHRRGQKIKSMEMANYISHFHRFYLLTSSVSYIFFSWNKITIRRGQK